MDLLLVPVPLFNKDMTVAAYYFRYQKGNGLTTDGKAAGLLDGAMNSPLLETLRAVGSEAFSMDKPLFVPVSAMMLLGDLRSQCPPPYEKVVFLLGGDVEADENTAENLKRLREDGFRFGLYQVECPEDYASILVYCDYLFISQNPPAAELRLSELPESLRNIRLVAADVNTVEEFDTLKLQDAALFEGRFYRMPVTKGNTDISPLKVNMIRLINMIQDENFDFKEISVIIQRDTALSISLLRMVNSLFHGSAQKIKTIPHAVAILGQREVRKWVTTAVARTLGSDKPDEITHLSLIRAKFAENLAALFDMDVYRQSLFLTGLFSVLDIVLEKTMSQALDMVMVSNPIRNALVSKKGEYYPVMEMILSYESADWKAVSRQMILRDISAEQMYDAYIGAVTWYRDLLYEEIPEPVAAT